MIRKGLWDGVRAVEVNMQGWSLQGPHVPTAAQAFMGMCSLDLGWVSLGLEGTEVTLWGYLSGSEKPGRRAMPVYHALSPSLPSLQKAKLSLPSHSKGLTWRYGQTKQVQSHCMAKEYCLIGQQLYKPHATFCDYADSGWKQTALGWG